MFKDQLAESECQKTKENIIPPSAKWPLSWIGVKNKTKGNVAPCGKFCLVENDLKVAGVDSCAINRK